MLYVKASKSMESVAKKDERFIERFIKREILNQQKISKENETPTMCYVVHMDEEKMNKIKRLERIINSRAHNLFFIRVHEESYDVFWKE